MLAQLMFAAFRILATGNGAMCRAHDGIFYTRNELYTCHGREAGEWHWVSSREQVSTAAKPKQKHGCRVFRSAVPFTPHAATEHLHHEPSADARAHDATTSSATASDEVSLDNRVPHAGAYKMKQHNVALPQCVERKVHVPITLESVLDHGARNTKQKRLR